MLLKNAGSQIVLTSVVSNMFVTFIVEHVDAGFVRKHCILPLSTPVTSLCAHCSLRDLWSLHNGSRCNGMWATIPALKRQWWTVEADSPNSLQYSKVDSTLWMKLYGPSQPCGQDGGHPMLWSHYVVQYLLVSAYNPLLPLVPYMHNCHSSIPCTSRNVTLWQTCFPETNHSALFKCTHLLILHPFASMRHTCTSFHVSTLFGSAALTEQGRTLTLLVTQEMPLLGLCVCSLSVNVINYWWYTGLHISQVWSRSEHSVWVLHFS